MFLFISLSYYVLITESYDGSLPGKMCTFLSSPHCREALDLRKGKTYLIMGASEGLHKDEASQSWVFSGLYLQLHFSNSNMLIHKNMASEHIPRPNLFFTLLSSGVSMYSLRKPGSSTGPLKRSVRLRNTFRPASAWKSWPWPALCLDVQLKLKLNKIIKCSFKRLDMERRTHNITVYFVDSNIIVIVEVLTSQLYW